MLKEQVREFARKMGADLVGVANKERWQNAPEMLRPQAHLPEARSVIVMGIHHPDASVEWGGLPDSNNAGPFQIGMIPKLDTMSRRMARFLEEKGEQAVPYPCTGFWRHRPYKEIDTTNTASFSHRHAAVAAGLGAFGLNNLFMSPRFGPRQRLVSVITSAQLAPDPLYDGSPLCDNCRMCAKNCPGNNFAPENLLPGEKDTVVIEDKQWSYAKLNRWRCLWGEQFAFDMSKLKDFDVRNEEDLHRADEMDMERRGGEFGSCLRFCMAHDVRYWDRSYTTAPRRKKSQKPVDDKLLLNEIQEIAKKNGAFFVDIRPLSEFDEDQMKLIEGYPMAEMKSRFQTVISMAIQIPAFPAGAAAIEDNADYLKAAAKVRMSIASYDLAQYIDNMGYEAMQDWMSLGEQVDFFEQAATQEAGVYTLLDGEKSPERKERYKLAAGQRTGVQREQQSMTAGQQGQTGQSRVISCAVITNLELPNRQLKLDVNEISGSDKLENLSILRNVDQISVASAKTIPQLPDTLDINRLLPGAKNLICLSTALPEYIVKLAGKQKADCATTYSYLQYQTLRELIWSAHDLCRWLGQRGAKSLPLVDASMSSIRTAAPYWEFSWAKLGHPSKRANAPLAAAAGLGQIGNSGLLLSEDYGPNQIFVFVVTDANLPTTPISEKDICLRCGKCADACEVKALDKKKYVSIPAGTASYDVYFRDEQRCEWARSLCIPGYEKTEKIGWRKYEIERPESVTPESAQALLDRKDPLQVRGYLYSGV